MTVKNVIESLCRKQGLTQKELSDRLGYACKTSVSNVINSDNEGMTIRLDTLLKWLDALDCQIIIENFCDDEEFILDGESEGGLE